MWEGFIDYLEDAIERYGLVRIAGSIGFIGALVIGLGGAASPEALGMIASISIIALLLVTCLALFVDRRHLYKRRNEMLQVLNRYGDSVVESQRADSFEILEWRESVHVHKNGDSDIQRWLVLRAGREPLKAFWHRSYMAHGGDDYSYRRRVRISVRHFSVIPAGEGQAEQRQAGVEYLVSTDWDEHSLTLFIHPVEAIAPGETANVYIALSWPGYSSGLIDRNEVAPMEWTFRRKVGQLDSDITLDKAIRVDELRLPITPHAGCPQPEVTVQPSGTRVVFRLTAPPVDTCVGYRLQLR